MKQKTNIPYKGFKIPTIVNEKIVKCEVKNTRRTEGKLNKTQSDKCQKMRNKVQIIGDSHFKNYVDKINQYVNTKFSISSFIKPGADIKQLISSGEKDPIETITNLVINIATIKCDTPEETLTNSETKIPEDKCDTPNIATNQQNPTRENESKELGGKMML